MPTTKIPHVCEYCRETFEGTVNQRFCSSTCSNRRRLEPLEIRFWRQVKKMDSGCWVWTGVTTNGYGQISYGGKGRRAHRVSWELHCGTIPDGLLVLHKCDNPPCVNPSHLFLGTHQDNMDDAIEKGRRPTGELHPSRLHPELMSRGEDNGSAKLTAEQVMAIRDRKGKAKHREIAKEFGIARSTVSTILRGEIWRHLS
jgi:hypothetical protein